MQAQQALALWAVIPAALGAACCVTGRRPGRPEPVTAAAMALMVLAMADTMFLGGRLLPPLAWAAVLSALALAVLLTGRHAAARPRARERAVHLGAMAVLTAAMAPGFPGAGTGTVPGAGHGSGAAAMAGMPGMPMTATPAVGGAAVVLLALLAACVYAVALCAAAALCGNARLAAERVAGAVSVMAMAGMLVPR